ncbi:hypothetical protein C823_008044 [Eubacterium plexicaudatum ASF492]|nr:hypothetical protein C823_008044 [Eubacterium plexicaudatum ASF492]
MGRPVCTRIGYKHDSNGKYCAKSLIWLPAISSAITGPVAACVFKIQMNGAAIASGMGTCGLVGQIGLYTGWVSDIAAGKKLAITQQTG